MSSGVDAKFLKSTKFPPEYSKKVDMQKVNIDVMKQYVFPPVSTCCRDGALTGGEGNRWIAKKVVEILANDDDVVIDFICGMLEEGRFVCSLFSRGREG